MSREGGFEKEISVSEMQSFKGSSGGTELSPPASLLLLFYFSSAPLLFIFLIPQIYEESLAKSGEEFGPSSNQVSFCSSFTLLLHLLFLPLFLPALQTIRKLQDLDLAMQHLEQRLEVTQMKEFVNVIILSDHGRYFEQDTEIQIQSSNNSPWPGMTHGHHTFHSGFDVDQDLLINKVQLQHYLKEGTYRWAAPAPVPMNAPAPALFLLLVLFLRLLLSLLLPLWHPCSL